MTRCRWCRSDNLETIEYLEVSLFGETIRVTIRSCQTCGMAETVSTDTAPAVVPT